MWQQKCLFLQDVLIMRISEDQEKDKLTLKFFWTTHFLSIKSFLGSFSKQRFMFRSTIIPEIPEIWKVSSISLPKEVFYPSMYTAVLQNVITRTFSPSPVYYFRPQLSAASFKKVSGESSACQVADLSLAVCELHEILEREGNPVVVAVPWLSTNIGSRQATLAAKKAWIQWSTAKRFENSSSWKRNEPTLR